MNIGVTIYCLPNIRHPWVLAFDPHPWGCGALRVKESSALIVFERFTTTHEDRYLEGRRTYMAITFADEAALLAYEDGQHEYVNDVADAITIRRVKINAIYAKVASKQAAKKAKTRRRIRLSVVAPSTNISEAA